MVLINSLIHDFTCLPTCLMTRAFTTGVKIGMYKYFPLWSVLSPIYYSLSSLSTEAPSIIGIYKIQFATTTLSWGNNDSHFAFLCFAKIGYKYATLQKDTFYWTIAYCLYLYSYHIIHYNLSQLPMIIVY